MAADWDHLMDSKDSGRSEVGPAAGYRSPPVANRFKKGRSGNPRGRPRGRHRIVPYDTILGQMVTIREDGLERRVTAAEAFLLQLTRKGLQGDNTAARASLGAIETARSKRGPIESVTLIKRIFLVPFGIGTVMQTLGLAIKKYPTDKKRVRWELQPWIVEAALARLAPRQLSEDEQREVCAATRTPHKVKWPEWWVV